MQQKSNINCFNCAQQHSLFMPSPLLGDNLYQLSSCSSCSLTFSFKRFMLSWVDVTLLILYHLSLSQPPAKIGPQGHRFYHYSRDICACLEKNWNYLWTRKKSLTWKNSVAGCLSTHPDKFMTGNRLFENEHGLWALLDLPSLVNLKDFLSLPKKPRLIACDVASDGTCIDTGDHKTIKKRKKDAHHHTRQDHSDDDSDDSHPSSTKKENDSIENIADFAQIDDELLLASSQYPVDGKPPAWYQALHAGNSIMLYPDLENLDEPVQMCSHPTHSAPQMKIDKNTVYTDKGYRLAKASHGVFEGYWYFEVLVENHTGHTRLGWSQISGDLQAPCGYDAFSYSFRDNPGVLFHESKPQDDPGVYSQGYGPGDIMGVSIYLPPLSAANRIELERRMWNPSFMKDYIPIRANPLQKLLSSEIRYYKNGQDMGVAFKDIYFGKYYPAVSSYMGGKVTFNFGPDFKYPAPEGSIAYSHSSSVVFWDKLAQPGVPLIQKVEESKDMDVDDPDFNENI